MNPNPVPDPTPVQLRPQHRRINRLTWLLWIATFAVVMALAASVPLIYVPLQSAVDAADGRRPTIETYYALVGLSGLVLIFCLYVTLKQRELNRMREALEREEEDKESVRARLSELSALFQVSTTLNLQLRLNVILEIIVRRVVSTLRAQQASIMIYNAEDGVLDTRASYGLESEFARHARARLGEGIAGWVAERKEAVLLSGNASPESEFKQHYKSNRNITSALSLPLKVGERCVGVLNVNRINHPEPFKEHHRDMLRMFAEHVGAVIDRAEAMDRLNLRTRALEEANLKLNELNQMKDVFLSTASHELKTPLSSVIAYTELLEDNLDRLEPDQRADFLRRLRGEALRLMGLIEDILDLSRLESGKLVLRRQLVDLNEVVRDSVETSRQSAEKHSLDLEEDFAEDLPQMMIDEVKMRQVVVNLLGNAIRFSPDRATVTVRTRREPDHFIVEVADNGPGIPADETTHIFELFAQGGRGRDAREGGLGIGLHLVKRITELHGGHVGVNSVPGEGSTFWVRLPLSLTGDSGQSEDRRAA